SPGRRDRSTRPAGRAAPWPPRTLASGSRAEVRFPKSCVSCLTPRPSRRLACWDFLPSPTLDCRWSERPWPQPPEVPAQAPAIPPSIVYADAFSVEDPRGRVVCLFSSFTSVVHRRKWAGRGGYFAIQSFFESSVDFLWLKVHNILAFLVVGNGRP